MRNPCRKDCPDRSPTCHSECEMYLEYSKFCEERRKERMKQNPIHDYIKEAVKKSRGRNK